MYTTASRSEHLRGGMKLATSVGGTGEEEEEQHVNEEPVGKSGKMQVGAAD